MNLRHSYEQLMADKLRKLPGPDADASWQQMKQLLDDDDRRTGGSKRPPGGGGWWRTGVIAIVLATSLWLYLEKPAVPGALAKNTSILNTTDQKSAGTTAGTTSKTTSATNTKTDAIDKNTTLPATEVPTGREEDNNENVVAASPRDEHSGAPTALPTGKRMKDTKKILVRNAPHQQDGTMHEGSADQANLVGASGTQPYPTHPSPGNKTQFPENTSNENAALRIINSKQPAMLRQDDIAGANVGNASADPLAYNRKNQSPKNKKTHSAANGAEGDATAAKNNFPENKSAAAGEDWFARLNGLKIPGKVPAPGTSFIADSIEAGRGTAAILNNDTKKAVTKSLRDKELEDITRKEKKSFHLNLSNVFKPFSLSTDPEPRWAAGIALNSGITVQAQGRYNYNMNAKSGTLLDYIPSVYLQFHLNDYVYAQTELNFISPQYTPQLLVSQQTSDLTAMGSPGSNQQKSIYIQKLYYFNLPVTLHYSPVNNFYFSAGLQFSSFQSGLVNIQEKQYATLNGPDHPGSVTNTVLKFKDDSIAAKLSPNEWRWQVGADYYIKRFTVGLRYNKAFKDLVNVNLSNTLPATPLRNQSLLLSVRYNLFESRKKGNGDQKN